MHVFTSITANYLPKAAVLAYSIKRLHPDAVFHLVLCDQRTDAPRITTACFDHVITIDKLPIQDLPSWIFKHRLVELCTAVKGPAIEYIAREFAAERIYYFDPDIAVLGPLDDLERALDRHSILLTPHQCHPETDVQAIIDNEICSLKHGVYNLGFLAVRMTEQGQRFVAWWAERLRQHCYDDKANGLFTDQRWVDLAPAFFDDIGIMRDPQYNVATWNLTHRRAQGRAPYDILINGRPLVFYHFSGFDSGAQLRMLERYGAHSPVLFELRDWYIARCEELGQSTLSQIECVYNFFDNGERVTDAHRLCYRNRSDLQYTYPDPFATGDVRRSYFHWYQSDAPKEVRPSLLKLVRDHAPSPALRIARSARKAWRRFSMPA
jgi:lipopolysaccharide biosynthesis glycosyltransferase